MSDIKIVKYIIAIPSCPEPVPVDLLRSTGVPVRQPYLPYRPARLHRLAESISPNRFLGSINVYKYGLCSLP
jgi:hypothetical protein